jgi:ABC-type lipoprotein release transport system permease subunit
MLKGDIIFAFRNLRRNKLVSAINIMSLTIGISACLVIFLIVNYELAVNRSISEGDRIYRVYSKMSGIFSAAGRGVPNWFGTTIRETFTGVDAVCNFHQWGARVSVPGEKGDRKTFGWAEKLIVTDPSYFDIFSDYQWLHGNARQSLSDPHRIVLTRRRAKTFFGDLPLSSIIGKEIIYQDSLVVTVSGIVEDLEHTDLEFEEFISFSTIERSWLQTQIRVDDLLGTYTSSQLFIKASAGTSAPALRQQLTRLSDLYVEKRKDKDLRNNPQLQPLSELHFNTEIGIFSGSSAATNKSTLHILSAIAILLLVLAIINFINLETAQASRRAKEVGVRKVLGSSRGRLIRHFLIDSLILTSCSVCLSLVLTERLLQIFGEFIPDGVSLDLTDLSTIGFLTGCIAGVTLLAGLYPAFVLSSCKPALALKNIRSDGGSRASFIRKGLTVFQFTFSQILIVAALAIGMQIDYMLSKDLGFTSEAIVYFEAPWWEGDDKRLQLRRALELLPEVEAVSQHNGPPSSEGYSSNSMEFDNGKEIQKHAVFMKHADTAYLRLYNIELLAGRNILPSDSVREYLINETYLHMLGFQNPEDGLGKIIQGKPVVGIVKDFNSRSLHSAVDPVAIFDWRNSNYNCFGLKLSTRDHKINDLSGSLNKIEAAWKKVYPDDKLEYKFLDDTLEGFYQEERRIGKLARTAMAIAVLISCLGLFGLSSFTVNQRTKEIGIRKVLGATVNSIMMLLSKDFLGLVLIAFILSGPVAYYITDKWLQDFSYRMDISAWLFIVSGLASVLTALMTISFRTVRAAKSDPVKSLRYE